ncbi:MAG TPA: cysteine methyltransferase, partial [Vicinamibacteria bacterium]
MQVEAAEVASPVGAWGLAATPQGVCLLHFEVDWDAAGAALARRFGPVSLRDAPDPCGAVSRLAAYFS